MAAKSKIFSRNDDDEQQRRREYERRHRARLRLARAVEIDRQLVFASQRARER